MKGSGSCVQGLYSTSKPATSAIATHRPFFATARTMIMFFSNVPLAQHYQKVYLNWERHLWLRKKSVMGVFNMLGHELSTDCRAVGCKNTTVLSTSW